MSREMNVNYNIDDFGVLRVYDGRADGIEQGWQGCIEENNLYERYYYGE